MVTTAVAHLTHNKLQGRQGRVVTEAMIGATISVVLTAPTHTAAVGSGRPLRWARAWPSYGVKLSNSYG